MIVFVPALFTYYERYGALKQYDEVSMPVYRELKRNGVDVKWGTWKDEADAYVCTNPYKFRGKKQRLIYCPDGLGLQEDVYQVYGGILFPGPYWKWCFDVKRRDVSVEQNPCYPPIGWPPLDLWFSSERGEREEQLRETLNLPHEKTILVAGLYDGMGGFASRYMERAVLKLMDSWKNYNPVNIIYKGHVITTMDFTNNTIRKDWMKLKNRMDSRPYCNFVNPMEAGNIFDYSLVSDILISGEGCTALTAFMAVGIPTIQLGMRWYTDIRSRPGEGYIGTEGNILGYSHSVKRYRPYPQIFMPGLVSEVEELPRITRWAINHPNEYDRERKAYLKEILYKVDGKTSKRAANAIVEIAEIWS